MVFRNGTSVIPSVILWLAVFVLSGCEGGNDARALFTKPDLFRYERYAVVGLDPEQEQIFMAEYVRAFSERIITFVERSRLQEVVGEQDLLRGRLDERMRARVKRILGVEALIMCDYSSDEQGRQEKLRVRIVDSETGAIVGSVLVAASGDFEIPSRHASQALKDDLFQGSHRGY